MIAEKKKRKIHRKMRIVDMDWSPQGLFFTINCACGSSFPHPVVSSRDRVKCHRCGTGAHLHTLRKDWEELSVHQRVGGW